MSEWVYVALHRSLFVLHAVLAAYVAAGSLWLAMLGVARDRDDPIARTLRDWLPFVLGLAITFGVGPLLFVQLLDGGAFYTANLLLSHRLLALLPALILGFYLLYVLKTDWAWVRSRAGSVLVPLAAFACFGFTAWTWSENHLLSQAREQWPEVYAAGPGMFWHAELPFRLAVFAGLALQSTAALLAIQLRQAVLRLAVAAVAGAVLTTIGLLVHPSVAGVTLLGPSGIVLLLAEVATVTAWIVALRRARLPSPVVALPLLLLAFERTAALRDAVRASRDGGGQAMDHATSQGFGAFAAMLVAVAAAIVWAVVRVRRDLRPD